MSEISTKRYISNVLLTFLYPLGGLVYSIKHLNWGKSEKLFFLFCIYFGLAFIYFSEGSGLLGDGADSERYALYLMQAYDMPHISLSDYLALRGERFDYYASFLLYVVSRFTGNPQIFFCVVATVMGFFYAKVTWLIIRLCKTNDFYVKILIVFLILIAPIWKINGVRWWTALYIFLYGVLSYIYCRKWYYLVYCFCSFLIHYTFLYPIFVASLGLFLPSRKILPYLALFLGINLLNNFDLTILERFLAKILPENYAENTIGYLTFEYKASRNWFADSGKYVTMGLNVFLVLLFYIKGKRRIETSAFLRRFFVVSLLLASLCLIINMAPWGGRFLDLGNFCLYALFCLLLSDQVINSRTRYWIKYSIPFLLYVILFQIRGGFYAIGIFNLLCVNFFTVFFMNDNYPIIKYIDLLM